MAATVRRANRTATNRVWVSLYNAILLVYTGATSFYAKNHIQVLINWRRYIEKWIPANSHLSQSILMPYLSVRWIPSTATQLQRDFYFSTSPQACSQGS